MIIEIKIPSPGESVTEVEIASWLVNDGDFVEKDQEIAEVESDKATLPLMAEESGKITILAEMGKTIKVGTVACTIDTDAKGEKSVNQPEQDSTEDQPPSDSEKTGTKIREKPEKPLSGKTTGETRTGEVSSPPKETGKAESKESAVTREIENKDDPEKIKISPLAKRLMEEENISTEDILKGLKRITRNDVVLVSGLKDKRSDSTGNGSGSRESTRKRMSLLRRKLSSRLVAVKNETAMLTTFNEVDMSDIIKIRKTYQERFTEKHGIKLGFMSLFVKAVTGALEQYPNINSYLEGDEIITPGYHDIGIAVQTEKGLMVPVLRNTERMSLAEIEKGILEMAERARKNRISIEEMSGGTFSITNGGVFGSLLSTPILNPPQSGILGMHNIVERPVAIGGKVEIRPMMYIALSYDHRIIDGRDSVSFLVRVKEMIEDPLRMISGGKKPGEILLDL
jgi:2-oxoglutarate dehydrogenase E2 component (dihydrolipoamide succinyltransferase)